VVSLQAALEARIDPDTVIVARTDARAQFGIKEAIARACRYAEVGADVIFVEAPQSVEEIEQIAAVVEAPLLLNLVPGGLTPKVEHNLLAELGYRIAIHPGAALAAVVPAAAEALGDLVDQTPALDATADPAGFFDLFGLGAWNKLGERYREIDHVGLPGSPGAEGGTPWG
jgi:2-methylisocitrate lyase-like PEP mutase family enzyme